ncbi:hypothetical protein GYMLUDRAFT_1021766 [Collybiopsis luxurians FD-317 M1]|uniref:Uncharacterized protein n=1 Tax=Collybiopsis luxurians FD-317 M1 TaxID=944289 RepID=A0A0D0BJM2_9AGAR|nr:hypothetical protein GYMLUDRAFT_1021766 [Collybiopsis luxurians FD-317 M1]
MHQLQVQNKKLTESLNHVKDQITFLTEHEKIYAAQAVLQDMTLSKMNSALHTKEVKKSAKPDKEVLPNAGFGRLWTEAKVAEFQEGGRAGAERGQEEIARVEEGSKRDNQEGVAGSQSKVQRGAEGMVSYMHSLSRKGCKDKGASKEAYSHQQETTDSAPKR